MKLQKCGIRSQYLVKSNEKEFFTTACQWSYTTRHERSKLNDTF